MYENSWSTLAETIKELCSVCKRQSRIIEAQADALAQLGAVILEEERLAIKKECDKIIGDLASAERG